MQTEFTDEQLANVELKHGSHSSIKQGHCAIEWLSYVANEPFSDSPPCMREKGTLRSMAIKMNDRMPEAVRNSVAFKRAILACLTAEASPEMEKRRAFRAADWAVRESTPFAFESAAAALESRGLTEKADALRAQAVKLRAVTPVTSEESAQEARSAANAAYAAANAAYAAYAAYAAAAYAAYAAYDAAYAAANAAYAAYDAAAAAAAANAARSEAWNRAIALLAELAAMRSQS